MRSTPAPLKIRRVRGKNQFGSFLVSPRPYEKFSVVRFRSLSSRAEKSVLSGWRVNLLRIEGNRNSNRYIREVLQPEIVVFLQGIRGATFLQDNARPHVADCLRLLLSTHVTNAWPAYSPYLMPIEHVWDLDLIGQHLARDSRPTASKINFCCAYK
ncbi:transposable element Tc1 transposase [Trichonephila clavipes]|nr:transposable element Tc1 transposase [Trichonephila clavipes]